MINLEKYSKAELIWIIGLMAARSCSADLALAESVEDLRQKRLSQQLDQLDALNREAASAMREYLRIMAPYDGQRYADIPDEVLISAGKALKQAEVAEAKYMRLSKRLDREAGKEAEQA